MSHQNGESYPRDQYHQSALNAITFSAVLCAVKFSYCKFCSQHHNLVFDYFNHKFFSLDITRLKKVGTSFLRKINHFHKGPGRWKSRHQSDNQVDGHMRKPLILYKWTGQPPAEPRITYQHTSELDSHKLNQESQVRNTTHPAAW